MAEAVGYPLKTFTKVLEALRKALGFFLYPLKHLLQSVESIRKSRWVFFPYPLKALRKAVGKSRSSTRKRSQKPFVKTCQLYSAMIMLAE